MKFKDEKIKNNNGDIMDIVLGNRYIVSSYKLNKDSNKYEPSAFEEVDDNTGSVFTKDDLSNTDTKQTSFAPLTKSEYAKTAKKSKHIVSPADTGNTGRNSSTIKSVNGDGVTEDKT